MTMTDISGLWTIFASRAAAFAADQRGATAIEYGLIAAGISVAIIATVFSLGSSIKDVLYVKIGSALN
jgi:pilus assembly protein Flp/PilA